jgi:cell division septum initiation protein DivIVA
VKRVTDLEREVVHLRAMKAEVGTAMAAQQPTQNPLQAAARGLTWSLPVGLNNGTPINIPPTTGATGEVETLKQRVSALEKKVPDSEDQLSGETIVVAGAEFLSLNEAGAWLTANAPTNGDYAFS